MSKKRVAHTLKMCHKIQILHKILKWVVQLGIALSISLALLVQYHDIITNLCGIASTTQATSHTHTHTYKQECTAHQL